MGHNGMAFAVMKSFQSKSLFGFPEHGLDGPSSLIDGKDPLGREFQTIGDQNFDSGLPIPEGTFENNQMDRAEVREIHSKDLPPFPGLMASLDKIGRLSSMCVVEHQPVLLERRHKVQVHLHKSFEKPDGGIP